MFRMKNIMKHIPGNVMAVQNVKLIQFVNLKNMYNRVPPYPAKTPMKTKSNRRASISAPRLAGDRNPSTAKNRVVIAIPRS
mmetsp:Transcript_9082/g.14504  ORF Transcript_9082/g.14504 Transcript_9082/m.14504 type:complete len:81 (+) Transcript_9082:825-1067(+)